MWKLKKSRPILISHEILMEKSLNSLRNFSSSIYLFACNLKIFNEKKFDYNIIKS